MDTTDKIGRLTQPRKFSNMFRFIDDLTPINDGSEFEKVYHKIYFPELELKLECSICLELLA